MSAAPEKPFCPPNGCPLLDPSPLGVPQMIADLKREVERLKAFRWQVLGAIIVMNFAGPAVWFLVAELFKLRVLP